MVSPNFTSRKIVVIGTGYVGLPAALLLARAGHSVVGVDIDENIVQAINAGILHIKEDQLQAIMDDPEVIKKLQGNMYAFVTPLEDGFISINDKVEIL